MMEDLWWLFALGALYFIFAGEPDLWDKWMEDRDNYIQEDSGEFRQNDEFGEGM